jgi:predicted GIY-YIG superfamily endonuclease
VNDKFKLLVVSLEPSYQKLMAMTPVKATDLPRGMPKEGIYLFSKDDRHLYVGRTGRLRQRIREHCQPSSTHNSAPFAFFLARQQTGRTARSYKQEGSRLALAAEPAFQDAFVLAKANIQTMDLRWVEETDPLRQALLEIYVSVVLGTLNDFENH